MRSVVHASLFLRNDNAKTQQSSRTLDTLASLPFPRQYDCAYYSFQQTLDTILYKL